MDHFELVELLKRILKKSDLYSLASKYTDLRQSGDVYVGRCPFHDDIKESFTVNAKEKNFYCSDCKAGGGVFKFIALIRNCTLREAVKIQARYVGVNLFTDKKDFESEQINRKQKSLIELHEYARDFYHEILIESQAGESCRKYLESRGISKTALKKFGLGFASESADDLAIFLDSYGFSNELALESLLVTIEENVLVDRLQDCIVFPIEKEKQLVGFIGQVFNFDKKSFYETEGISSQFVCVGNTQVFEDIDYIFGFVQAKQAIIRSNSVLIVDSPLTAVMLNGSGIENAVAIIGDKFSLQHAENIDEYAQKIIFCLQDGKSLQIEEDALREIKFEDSEIFVAAFPKSPEDFIFEEGAESFKSYLENPLPCQNYNHFKEIKSEPVVNKKVLELNEKLLKLRASLDTPNKLWAEEVILRVCREDSRLVAYITNVFVTEGFSKLNQEIFNYLKLCYEEDIFPDEESARKFLHEAAYNELVRISQVDDYRRENDRNAFDEAVNILKNKILSAEYSQTKKDILDNLDNSGSKLPELDEIIEQQQAI